MFVSEEKLNEAFKILELKKTDTTLTEESIRKAYKKAALKYHPDKNKKNPEVFTNLEDYQKICKQYIKDPIGYLSKSRQTANQSYRYNFEERVPRTQGYYDDSFAKGPGFERRNRAAEESYTRPKYAPPPRSRTSYDRDPRHGYQDYYDPRGRTQAGRPPSEPKQTYHPNSHAHHHHKHRPASDISDDESDGDPRGKSKGEQRSGNTDIPPEFRKRTSMPYAQPNPAGGKFSVGNRAEEPSVRGKAKNRHAGRHSPVNQGKSANYWQEQSGTEREDTDESDFYDREYKDAPRGGKTRTAENAPSSRGFKTSYEYDDQGNKFEARTPLYQGHRDSDDEYERGHRFERRNTTTGGPTSRPRGARPHKSYTDSHRNGKHAYEGSGNKTERNLRTESPVRNSASGAAHFTFSDADVRQDLKGNTPSSGAYREHMVDERVLRDQTPRIVPPAIPEERYHEVLSGIPRSSTHIDQRRAGGPTSEFSSAYTIRQSYATGHRDYSPRGDEPEIITVGHPEIIAISHPEIIAISPPSNSTGRKKDSKKKKKHLVRDKNGKLSMR